MLHAIYRIKSAKISRQSINLMTMKLGNLHWIVSVRSAKSVSKSSESTKGELQFINVLHLSKSHLMEHLVNEFN